MSRVCNVFRQPCSFIVEGSGRFPMDMLRHDCATPADAEAVESIQTCFEEYSSGPHRIRLDVAQRLFITEDRWASFGWTVTDICQSY